LLIILKIISYIIYKQKLDDCFKIFYFKKYPSLIYFKIFAFKIRIKLLLYCPYWMLITTFYIKRMSQTKIIHAVLVFSFFYLDNVDQAEVFDALKYFLW